MQNSLIYGSPATVIERIREYESTGIQQMMAMFIWDAPFLEQSGRSFQLFVDEVLPHFTGTARRAENRVVGLLPRTSLSYSL